jgi:hypothetical protein
MGTASTDNNLSIPFEKGDSVMIGSTEKNIPTASTMTLMVLQRIALMSICFTCFFATEDLWAQGGAGVGGGVGGVPAGADGNFGGDFAGNDGNLAADNAGGGGDGGFGDDAAFGEVLGGAATSDQRNQGFVGSVGTRIQESGFVGPPGETTGPPLVDGASFGGGVNDVSLGTGGGNVGGGNNRNRNAGFGGFGQQGPVKGFEVMRSSVRANLRPSFDSPQVAPEQINDRFRQTIRQLPNTSGDGEGVQISINGTTATINGWVRSREEGNRIERQLRLQPGVYRIDNQVQIFER